MLSGLAYFTLSLILIVLVHESGHFLVARWCGVRVLRFSFGFGKVLGKWRDKLGTEYTWSLLPFGGYVKFLDENEGPVTPVDWKYTFNRQPRWARVAIIVAGPLFNFVFAYLALWMVAVIGIESFAPRIASVKPGSVAYQAELAKNQEIIELDGHKINNWRDVHYVLMPLLGSTRSVVIKVKTLNDGQIAVHSLPLGQWKFDAKRADLLDSLGIVPLFPPVPLVVGLVTPHSPAASAGFELGDLITEVDRHPISDWPALAAYVRTRPGDLISVKIQRLGQPLTLKTHVGMSSQNKRGFLGLGARPPEIPAEWLRLERSSPMAAIGQAWHQTITLTVTTVKQISRTLFGQLPLAQLSGSVGIAKAASQSAQLGGVYYLFFIALLSISIGVLNLLPIPLLDGGYLLYELIELILCRPLSKEWKLKGIFLGMVLVLLLTLIALYNDLA